MCASISERGNKNQMPETAEGKELVAGSGSSSVVWKYFRFRASDVNQEQLICRESCRVIESSENKLHEGQEKQSNGC